MSGEPVEPPLVIVPQPLARLLAAVALVASSQTGPVALVGGLAITARGQMALVTDRPIEVDDVVDVLEPLADALER